MLKEHRETVSPRVYLQPTRVIEPGRGLIELKTAALKGVEEDRPLERSHRLAAAVAEAIAYTPGATDAHTTASEALEQGKGVCQDLTHAMIAVAHAAGIPARYVTGYLFTGDEGGRGGACLGGALRRRPRVDRVRSGEPLLPGRAVYPARVGAGRARRGADPRGLARRWQQRLWM